VYGLLFATILMGKSPKLGLDLQGGISVNLQPVEKGKVIDNVSDEQFDQAIEIIRKRVDALGVAEPEVSRQGNTISVQLPGAKDQAEVLAVVGSTAQLEFRPVLAIVGKLPTGKAKTKADETVAKLRKELGVPDGVTAAQVVADEQAKSPIPATDPAAAPADAAIVTEPAATETTAPETTVAASGGGRSVMAGRSTTQTPPGADPVPTSDAATTGTTTTTVPPTPLNQWGVNVYDPKFAELYQTETQLAAELTPTDEQSPEAEVTLKGEDGTVYKLGPVAVDGRAVKGATASLGQDGKWTVNPSFKAGVDNIDAFNAIAAKCYAGDPTCPDQGGGKGQLGIVLDGVVLSAPTINTPSFDADSIQISGSFTKDEAESLSVALRYGSLPIQLEPQQAETISATLGQGALEAGIIAGLIGVFIVLAFLMIYYRLLGLVTAVSLSLSASMLWVIMSNLQATVTLAGVVGIVASIGISLDSSIVFYESLKEDVRNGSSLRSSADKSFTTAYSTIVKADVASLIGAGVLYWLSIGPVRGFAFYLGVATLLDLFTAYFFLRPAVVVFARSKFGEYPKRFGIPVDDLEGYTDGRITPAASKKVPVPAGKDLS
ncbi:MAG: protein translocase subunit SecD, partial [Actinobacteria bacterium]|nr:protein translocase subunit SecD [Actinomycetota bacterium]